MDATTLFIVLLIVLLLAVAIWFGRGGRWY
jgi:hypothetical protein